MSLDIDSLAIDQAKANEGTWGTFSGAKFLIARYNNPKAQALRNEIVLANLEVVQAGGEAAEAVNAELNTRVLSETILLGWEDLTKGGEPLPFSPEVARTYIEDPRFAELRQFIENYSVARGNYQEKSEAEVADLVKDTAVA
jgi:hypothetical protein